MRLERLADSRQLLEHVGHLDALLGGLAVDEPAAPADLLVETQRVHRSAASPERVVEDVPHDFPVVALRVGEPHEVEHEVLGAASRQRGPAPARGVAVRRALKRLVDRDGRLGLWHARRGRRRRRSRRGWLVGREVEIRRGSRERGRGVGRAGEKCKQIITCAELTGRTFLSSSRRVPGVPAAV